RIVRLRSGVALRPALAPDFLGLQVGTQPDEYGMAHAPVRGPLGEAHLAHQLRLHPVIAAPRRPRRAEGRLRAGQRLEKLPYVVLHGPVEAAPDPRHVPELIAFVDADVQRAEVPVAAARLGIAADHEFLAALAFDLDPVGRSLARIGAVGALRDHPLEPHLGCGIEKRFAMLRDVVARLDDSRGRQNAGEAFLRIRSRSFRRSWPSSAKASEKTAPPG